jgi:recombination protein RecA
MALGLVTKAGAFFSYEDTRLGQGRENAKQFLKENKDICKKLEKAVRKADAEGTLSVPTRARGRK